MYEILSIGTQFFIYDRLRAAGVSKVIRKIFLAWAFFWVIAGLLSSFDLLYAEYDLMPLHLAEVIHAFSLTWVIITLYAFGSFFLMDLLTRFKGYTKKKVLLATLLTIVITLYSMFEAYYVTPRYVVIKSDKLKAERVRIVYLTDTHIGGLSTKFHLDRVMNIVNEASPDIFLLAGDILDGDMSYRTRELEMLKAAALKAPYGAFAVNGNHEHYWILDEDIEGTIREAGFNLLINERAELPELGITILGLDDMIHGWLSPVIKPEDKKNFVLVLKHRPGLPFDSKGNFDLQVSGHTHGGQFWPLGYFKNMAANSVQGLSKKSGGYVYVSNGSGFNAAMLRLFVPPEVTVIDLIREK